MNIAIVGAHSGSKLSAPYGSQEWEIWSLSPKNENELPHCDVWFELHKRFLSNPDADGVAYGDWLRQRPRVYMQALSPAIAGSVTYPKNEMITRFGSHFFTSSIAWMLALAITKEPTALGVWGVENSADEYHGQRQGFQFFLHLARCAGIELILPNVLNETGHLYGYDHAT